MKLGSIIGLCLASLGSATGLWLDVRKAELNHQPNSPYDQVVIPCRGGSGQYDYKYTSLPDDFVAQDQVIYVPQGSFNKNHRR